MSLQQIYTQISLLLLTVGMDHTPSVYPPPISHLVYLPPFSVHTLSTPSSFFFHPSYLFPPLVIFEHCITPTSSTVHSLGFSSSLLFHDSLLYPLLPSQSSIHYHLSSPLYGSPIQPSKLGQILEYPNNSTVCSKLSYSQNFHWQRSKVTFMPNLFSFGYCEHLNLNPKICYC